MKLLALFLAACALRVAVGGAEADQRFYEMRTYYAAPGKLDALNARFRNHTTKLFVKHGMVNVGYWLPATNTENKLVYLLSYPSREAREASWKAFGADPEWQTVAKASEKDGRLVTKAVSIFLKPTDFSPVPKAEAATPSRCFELRTYTASPGNLNNLLSRFRDHTLALFKKHGITNVGYFTPTEKAQGAEDTLMYILAHESQESAAKSFKAFREDPDWVAAKKASEVNGPLTTKVVSEFMVPTDYSPMR